VTRFRQNGLDTLDARKTTCQPINAVEKRHNNSTAVPDLQMLIFAFGSQLQEGLNRLNKRVSQKKPNETINQLSAAKAQEIRAQTIVLRPILISQLTFFCNSDACTNQ